MEIRRCYPQGKTKACNFTYDDGVTQDRRFVALLNRHGLKGTFNLNSQLMRTGFTWTHESGLEITRLSPEEAIAVYQGHEVASHTLTHPYLTELSREEILRQMQEDKQALEDLFQQEVPGFALPFTAYSDRIAQCAREAGFLYARISEESGHFCPLQDRYYWRAGVFHWSGWMEDFIHRFLQTDEELALCQIAGHSYDLDVMDRWADMEIICEKLGSAPEVWAATQLELVRYLMAMVQAEISESRIYNPTNVPLWFLVDGESILLPPFHEYT